MFFLRVFTFVSCMALLSTLVAREQQNGVSLHSRSKSIFVNGIGSNVKEKQRLTRLLSSYIYGTSMKKSAIDLVFNSGRWPWSLDEKAKEGVLDYLTDTNMWEVDKGKVKLVIFCHSNGAKIVKSALDPTEISSRLRRKYVYFLNERTDDVVKHITENVVVISFGGVTLIPEDHAKIVRSFISTSDLMAHGALSKESNGMRVSETVDPTEEEIYQFDYVTSMWLGLSAMSQFSNAKSNPSTYWTCGLSDSASSCDPNAHYLESYLEDEQFVRYISELLSVDEL